MKKKKTIYEGLDSISKFDAYIRYLISRDTCSYEKNKKTSKANLI